MEVSGINEYEIFLRLLVAAILASLIGLERERSHRAAGLRTYILVSIGSALFTLVGYYGFHSTAINRDPARVAAQIVTGIGFLGAGTILRQGVVIRGLTTAAGLWAAAAIGMACGVGWYKISVASTLLVIIVLALLKIIETSKMEKLPITLSLKLLKKIGNMDNLKNFLKKNQITTINVEIEEDDINLAYNLMVEVPPNLHKEEFINDLSSLGAFEIKWKGTQC